MAPPAAALFSFRRVAWKRPSNRPLCRKTAKAEEDLIDIWLYIAQNNPKAADRLLDRIEEKGQLLADNPALGQARTGNNLNRQMVEQDQAAGAGDLAAGRGLAAALGFSAPLSNNRSCTSTDRNRPLPSQRRITAPRSQRP